jgi:hypothetical protein
VTLVCRQRPILVTIVTENQMIFLMIFLMMRPIRVALPLSLGLRVPRQLHLVGVGEVRVAGAIENARADLVPAVIA